MAAEPALFELIDLDSPSSAPLATRVARADSFGRRLKGLLGRDGLAPGEGLWIEPCDSVHTFFMRFPIDVAFLDRQGKVVGIAPSLRPWRATRLFSTARVALELPAGMLAEGGVGEGRRLGLRPIPPENSPISP